MNRTSDSSLPHTIAQQAALQPEQLAVALGADRLSYRELETRASQLAHHLRLSDIGPDSLVALCLERSPEFVVAALAVLKCGAAYLPMDSAHPAERLRFIFEDSGAQLVLTQERFAGRFGNLATKVIALDSENTAISRQPTDFAIAPIAPDSLAYVIYTSGSTGQPKGVEITHTNLANLIAWHIRAFDLSAKDRATFQAGVGFDAAVWEIWPALSVGASLLIPDEATRLSPEALRDWLVAERVTHSFVSTAIAQQLIALPWPNETALRFLLTGADTLQRYPAPGLPFTFVNNYGPTEGTVVTTSGIVSPAGSASNLPSIGKSIDNVRVHIVDEVLAEVRDGEPGEICVSGAGVARGYRNRPELTAQSFVTRASVRMYRTGDRGRRLTNGEIEFLGRRDDQIKIRGYRIELNEINAILNAHPSVQASVVLAREDTPAEKRLVAYIVTTPGASPNEKILRDALRQRLPDYMEPSAFVWLAALPLTPNGKIDRDALPAPSAANTAENGEYVAPQTETEEALAKILCEVLKLPRVGLHDDFFQLGGHSLLGAQVIARVRGAFGTELKLLDVFDSPTVAQLSVKIEEAITAQLSAMSEAEVNAALAAFENSPNEQQPA
ncbi:MAG: non-ribosomal peptide synthetase [Chthoniobacterales bacterium]